MKSHIYKTKESEEKKKNAKTRKNLEAFYIALWKPDLNKKNTLKN